MKTRQIYRRTGRGELQHRALVQNGRDRRRYWYRGLIQADHEIFSIGIMIFQNDFTGYTHAMARRDTQLASKGMD